MAAPLFLSAQETYPLTKYLGQFFEQGYGNEGDEENLDLAAEGKKLYHAGWSYTLPEGFDTTGVHFADYSQFDLDATFRLTDKIGEQQWQVRVPGPQDEVARGIIPSLNPDFKMAAVVRQTDLYRPQEWEGQSNPFLFHASNVESRYKHESGVPAFCAVAMNQSTSLVEAGSDEGARPLNLACTKMKSGRANSRRAFLQYFFGLQQKSTEHIKVLEC